MACFPGTVISLCNFLPRSKEQVQLPLLHSYPILSPSLYIQFSFQKQKILDKYLEKKNQRNPSPIPIPILSFLKYLLIFQKILCWVSESLWLSSSLKILELQ